jgi:hypothetical protein
MSARRRRQRARQRSRAQRQRERQRNRTRRQKARQENRTRRASGRQAVRQEKIIQKGASGFYTPEGVKARGQVAGDLVKQGVSIAGMVGTGGVSGIASGLTGLASNLDLQSGFDGISRRDEIIGVMEDTQPQDMGVAGFGGFIPSMPSFNGGSSSMMEFDEEIEERKPFYTNPLVIGGGALALFLFLRRK